MYLRTRGPNSDNKLNSRQAKISLPKGILLCQWSETSSRPSSLNRSPRWPTSKRVSYRIGRVVLNSLVVIWSTSSRSKPRRNCIICIDAHATRRLPSTRLCFPLVARRSPAVYIKTWISTVLKRTCGLWWCPTRLKRCSNEVVETTWRLRTISSIKLCTMVATMWEDQEKALVHSEELAYTAI